MAGGGRREPPARNGIFFSYLPPILGQGLGGEGPAANGIFLLFVSFLGAGVGRGSPLPETEDRFNETPSATRGPRHPQAGRPAAAGRAAGQLVGQLGRDSACIMGFARIIRPVRVYGGSAASAATHNVEKHMSF